MSDTVHPIPDANAIREFVVVRTREVNGAACVSYYSVDSAGATKWAARDKALTRTEEQAILLCQRTAMINRSLDIRYTVEPATPVSVHTYGLDWSLRVVPTNGPGSRLIWRANAGENQCPAHSEWTVLVTPRNRMDGQGVVWGAALCHMGALHHGANATPEIDRYYDSAAEAMEAGARTLFALAPHLDLDNAAARDCIIVHVIEKKGREPERHYLTDFAGDRAIFGTDRSRAKTFSRDAALDAVTAFNRKAAAIPLHYHVERLDGRWVGRGDPDVIRALMNIHPHLCSTCGHAVGHPENCAANHGAPADHKTCSDWYSAADLAMGWLSTQVTDYVQAVRSLTEAAAASLSSVTQDLTAIAADSSAREMLACIRALRLSPGLRAIALERLRQVESEGYTPAHDVEHSSREFFMAAGAYNATARGTEAGVSRRSLWPWNPDGFKPTSPYRDGVKSGALTAAGLDVLGAPAGSAVADDTVPPEPVVLSGHSTANGEVFIRVGTLESNVLVRSSDAEIARLDVRIGDTVTLKIGDNGALALEAVDTAKRPPFARPMGKLEC